MGRVSTYPPTKDGDFLNALIADYFSQTDVNAQALASVITQVAGKHIKRGVQEELDDYIISKRATSTYDIVAGDGELVQTKTGLVAAIQWAHNQLSGGGSIGVRHAIYAKEWEQKLLISNMGITFHGSSIRAGSLAGEFTFQAKDALDDTMIEITGKKCHLYNFTIHGNKANQTNENSHGIYDNAGTASDLHLHDVYVFMTKGRGIQWGGGAGFAYGVYVEYCEGEGWFLTGASRNVFVQCGAYICEDGWFLYSNSLENRFIGCIAYGSPYSYYHGHGWYLSESDLNTFLGCDSVKNQNHGWRFYGAQRNQIIGGFTRSNSQHANNESDGIHFESAGARHCLRNTIMGHHILNTMTNKQRYGIRENDVNQDRNIVGSGCIVTDNVTGQISLQGANSIKSADVIED